MNKKENRSRFVPENCNFAIWRTEGDGLVRVLQGKFVFIKKPNCAGFAIGDEMPEEWELTPANEAARQEGKIY